MKKLTIIFLLLVNLGVGFSQETLQRESSISFDQDQKIQLATSTKDYPVTPGDIYLLTYTHAGTQVAKELLVQGDHTISFNVFGEISTEGKTFNQIQPEIENIINSAYPGSFPSITISSVGIFQVLLTGDILSSRYELAWGLTRLSEILSNIDSTYASFRNITIQDADGRKNNYDLYQALYHSNESQDPYLKPGDKVILERADFIASIEGEIQTPGSYQLKKDEGLQDLLKYAGWFTNNSDLSRIKVAHQQQELNEAQIYTWGEKDTKLVRLQPRDRIYVSSINQATQVIYIEVPTADTEPGTPGLKEVRSFQEGETASTLAAEVIDNLSPYAELDKGYVLRRGEKLPVDFKAIFRNKDYSTDILLQPDDLVAIPEGRATVTVAGAVFAPSNIPYSVGEDHLYYINLAGGIDPERNSWNAFSIRDSRGKRKSKKKVILPGDIIYVKSNDFIYNFNRNLPVITTSLALMTSVITLYATLNPDSVN